jgi:hypothetical protein
MFFRNFRLLLIKEYNVKIVPRSDSVLTPALIETVLNNNDIFYQMYPRVSTNDLYRCTIWCKEKQFNSFKRELRAIHKNITIKTN